MTPPILRAACAKCPFRKDVPIYLRAGRREQIARALTDGQPFWCHEYVEFDDDDENYEAPTTGPQCAGAVAALALDGGTTNLTRVEQRLGFRTNDLTRGPEVWALRDWPRVPEGATAETWDPDDDTEVETCGTVEAGCLAPAGYMGAGGGIVYGTEAADGRCKMCEEPLCSNCADENGLCGMCRPWDDGEDDD